MSIRSQALALLEQEPPNLEALTSLLTNTEDKFLTPDVASLRLGILDAINRLKNGGTHDEVMIFLQNIANGLIDDIEDIVIDFDIPDSIPGTPFSGVGFGEAREYVPMPGPDDTLLKAMAIRDSITARKISGDTITPSDIETYEKALMELGKSLLPLMKLHLDDLKDQ
jgi:hypothetical protein